MGFFNNVYFTVTSITVKFKETKKAVTSKAQALENRRQAGTASAFAAMRHSEIGEELAFVASLVGKVSGKTTPARDKVVKWMDGDRSLNHYRRTYQRGYLPTERFVIDALAWNADNAADIWEALTESTDPKVIALLHAYEDFRRKPCSETMVESKTPIMGKAEVQMATIMSDDEIIAKWTPERSWEGKKLDARR